MSSSFPRGLVAALLSIGSLGADASAQVYASERNVVAQTVSGTTITVDYYRPRARGRELFGKLVPWRRLWTPGANWATTLEVDRDVMLEGRPLPKGKYSVWVIPDTAAWTFVFNRTARLFHTRMPADSAEQLRLTVAPVVGAHVEMLTFAFPAVSRDSAELHFQWGTTHVPLRVAVGAAAAGAAPMTAEERAVYVGTYAMTYLTPQARGRTHTYTVFDSAGVLRLHRSDPMASPYDAQFDLHRIGEHRFAALMYQRGVLFGIEPAITIVFQVEGGRATGVEVQFAAGGVTTRGTRERP